MVAEQRTEFATTTAQIFIVREHVVASQRHDGVNFGIVHIFGGALEQVLVQLQQFRPLVAHAIRRRQFEQIGADPHGAIRGREVERHLVALSLHLQHAAVKLVIVRNAFAALHEHRIEIKECETDVNAFGQRHCARDAVNCHAFIGQRNVRAETDDDVLEVLDLVIVGVVDEVAELNNVRPFCGVHALAILGGQAGGFSVKYHDLHFVVVIVVIVAIVAVAIVAIV